MALYINTNIASLDAQNNLSASQMSLQLSLQRLSSGTRINSAKDDAAGLAISTRMTSQIQGLTQASQNANDGISMSQTAEGGMSTIADNLQRMRSLAVQAANGSNSTSDRQSIQTEIAQLVSQVNQVATETQYNGTNLLDGSLSNAQFQIGANANQTLDMSVGNLQAGAIGSFGLSSVNYGLMTSASTQQAVSGSGIPTSPYVVPPNTAVGGATLTVSGNATSGGITTAASTANPPFAETADQIATQINNNTQIQATGVTATAATSVTLNFAPGGTYKNGVYAGGTAITGAVSLNLYSSSSAVGSTPTRISISNGSGINDLAGLVSQINSQSGTSGITAVFDQTAQTITLTNTTGQNITVQNGSSSNTGPAVLGTNTLGQATTDSTAALAASNISGIPPVDAALDAVTIGGQVSFSSPTAYSITSSNQDVINTGGAANGAALSPLGTAITYGAQLNSVNYINVDTIAGANSAIQIIDAALLNVNNQEANMGAVQNRFTSVISNLSTAGQNLTQARSLIRDTNYASETANLTRSQILQQAGTAMLAQANSTPNGVMALLK